MYFRTDLSTFGQTIADEGDRRKFFAILRTLPREISGPELNQTLAERGLGNYCDTFKVWLNRVLQGTVDDRAGAVIVPIKPVTRYGIGLEGNGMPQLRPDMFPEVPEGGVIGEGKVGFCIGSMAPAGVEWDCEYVATENGEEFWDNNLFRRFGPGQRVRLIKRGDHIEVVGI